MSDKELIQDFIAQDRNYYGDIENKMALAKQQRGSTIFDWLIAIISDDKDHTGIELRLE